MAISIGIPPSRRSRCSTADATISSSEHQSRRGSADPACRRERSSSCSTRCERRAASPTIIDASSSRSAGRSVGERTASPAAMIVVSGVRRSWETARSSAVLRTSECRSAWVSTTSRCRRSRSSAAASSASSEGTTRSVSRCRAPSSRSPGTSRAADPAAPTWSGIDSDSPSCSATPVSIDAKRSSSAAASCRDARGSASSTLAPPSSVRAIAAARSASSRRRCASVARARATPATVDAITAAARKTPSTTQFWLSAT